MRRMVAPLALHVGEDRGNLLIVEGTMRGHVAPVHTVCDLDRAAHAVERDAHRALVRTEHPFRIGQRGSHTIEAAAAKLVTGGADRREKRFTDFEMRLLFGCDPDDGGNGGEAGFTGPDDDLVQFANPSSERRVAGERGPTGRFLRKSQWAARAVGASDHAVEQRERATTMLRLSGREHDAALDDRRRRRNFIRGYEGEVRRAGFIGIVADLGKGERRAANKHE